MLYCVLLGLHRLKRYDILSLIRRHCQVVQLQARTVRRVPYFRAAGWLAIAQKNQTGPHPFQLSRSGDSPEERRSTPGTAVPEEKWISGESLDPPVSMLVASSHYIDDCYPEFLTNPETNELLQADRYYIDYNVIIEFNGPQHDGATEHY